MEFFPFLYVLPPGVPLGTPWTPWRPVHWRSLNGSKAVCKVKCLKIDQDEKTETSN